MKVPEKSIVARKCESVLRKISHQGAFFLSNKPTILDKTFEANSCFHVKKRTTGKVQFLFFRIFLLVLTNF